MRIALAVEYSGTPYCGWQRQPDCHSVQAELEQALSKIAGKPITVHCAGRTDTGVHAIAQIVHFDTDVVRPMRAWTFGVNTHLDRHVSVHWASTMPDEFHARFKALCRSYRYTILNRDTRPALHWDKLGWVAQPLDVDRMQTAANQLLGTHDFSSFRSADCQARHAVRELQFFQIRRHGSLVLIDVVANGFLHNMVRILTGSLISIGKGDQPPEWLASLLAVRDRRQAGMTAKPQGLCFVQPGYPTQYGVPNFQINQSVL